MTIRVDSDEYKAWHEVGHAMVCVHLGGDVECIEFLKGHALGHAHVSCVFTPEIERRLPEIARIVALGGLAAEVFLLRRRLAEKGHDDDRDLNEIIFHNAVVDRAGYWGREVGSEPLVFEKEQDQEFMERAIGADGEGGFIPVFDQHFAGMQTLVRELCQARRVEGTRVKELLRGVSGIRAPASK